MRYLLFTIIFVYSTIVAAATNEITFTVPTQRIDNTPLPVEEIAGYRLYVDQVARPDLLTPADQTTFDITISELNSEIYLTTVDIDGRESAPSNIVNVVQDKSKPNAPVIITIKIKLQIQ